MLRSLPDLPTWEYMLSDGGALDIDDCPDCWERNAHIERYEWACRVFVGVRVLDFGSGVGFGSEMLAILGSNAVFGVDSSKTALSIARERHGGRAIFVSPKEVDEYLPVFGITCFECLEHLDDPAAFLKWASRVAHHIVVSTPVVPTMETNLHHKHDFTPSAFRKLVDESFSIVTEWNQIRPFTKDPTYAIIHGASKVLN